MTSQATPNKARLYAPRDAAAVIIANMVGVGVFTTIGFQLVNIPSTFAVLMLWVIGGIAALCGAASYAELGASLPRSGGEYNFLGEIYHPAAGFVSGWVSATIGFAAPIAAVSLAFGKYSLAAFTGGQTASGPYGEKALACALVILVAIIHSRSHHASGLFQRYSTALKIILILIFCAAAFLLTPAPQTVNIIPTAQDWKLMASPAYGVALIFGAFAYTGWNAATYISGELQNPQKDLPRILIFGTGLVLVLYVLLNYAFLYAAPTSELSGQVEIGYITARNIFGESGGRIAGAMLALLLISTVSAMTVGGPRALQMIGEDTKLLGFMAKVNQDNIPKNAIYIQSLIALVFILTSSFKTILVFAGAMLALNSFLAILGVFVLRWRQPDLPRPYRTWGYPFTPLIYLAITGFMLIFVVLDQPQQALIGLGVIALFAGFYFAANHISAHRE
jgi:APA family basic amino acid/polyamine antiporter